MPVITVTRQLGSEGDAIGQALAERLGFRYLDKRNIAQAMRVYGGDVEPGAPEIEEKQPSFWERLNEERRRHAILLRGAVYNFALEDNCVIVGVGGSMLLKGLSHVLKILTIAPFDSRVQRVMQRGSLDRPGPADRETAIELVRSKDRETAGYLRYMFNLDYLGPRHYDLVLNTGRWSVPAAAEYVAELLNLPEIAKTVESTQQMENLALAGLVEASLVNNAGIWVHGLKVTADRGEVTVTGEVITDEDRDVAEEIAGGVPGVRGVVNELRIQPPPLTGM
jgi:osmotically-inducible protein OsmY